MKPIALQVCSSDSLVTAQRPLLGVGLLKRPPREPPSRFLVLRRFQVRERIRVFADFDTAGIRLRYRPSHTVIPVRHRRYSLLAPFLLPWCRHATNRHEGSVHMARIIKAKLVLKLRAAGHSRSAIARAQGMSKRSVIDVFDAADELGIDYDDLAVIAA